ncbi:hypothetical protein VTK73DRAFT_9996 [Phialemonium thermophilum]|uniref:Cnl2/NKP2 family protein n=1 Tax=Phialemonium thermophilum TaxID=223376 RepID=A0ABR3Y560_9PEZI
MAPEESTILRNFLLIPSQLPAIISLQEFTALFPRSQQTSPHIRTLYRDLQTQRSSVLDLVSSNIESEIKRGKKLQKALFKARRQSEGEEHDDEIEIERILFGRTSGVSNPPRDLISALPELERASEELDGEIKRLEDEESTLRQTLHQIIGGFSDLRYGRLANPQLPPQLLESLSDLQEACKRKV